MRETETALAYYTPFSGCLYDETKRMNAGRCFSALLRAGNAAMVQQDYTAWQAAECFQKTFSNTVWRKAFSVSSGIISLPVR